MGVPVTAYAADAAGAIEAALRCAPLIVDGLIGYGLRDAPRGGVADLIRLAGAGRRILSLDVPSGLDPTSGGVRDPAIQAQATLTLALPKAGLLSPAARGHVGRLYLADIGVPPAAFERLGIKAPRIFGARECLHLAAGPAAG